MAFLYRIRARAGGVTEMDVPMQTLCCKSKVKDLT